VLLIIIHNDKGYLEEACKLIHAEGITDVTICEQKGLVKSLSGIRNNQFFGVSQPLIADEFDYALLAAVSDKDGIRQIKTCIKDRLSLYRTGNKALFLELPFARIEKLFKTAEEK